MITKYRLDPNKAFVMTWDESLTNYPLFRNIARVDSATYFPEVLVFFDNEIDAKTFAELNNVEH